VNARVLRLAGGIALLAAATAAAASAANPPPPIQPIPVNPGGPNRPPATATLSDSSAGAKPVRLVVRVSYPMVCGQPGRGKAIVTLPTEATVPSSIAATAVLVNGKTAPAVSVAGHDISIAMPTHKGVTCMSIGPGTLTLTLTRLAGIGNPRAAGTYMVKVRRNTLAFAASVKISA
jgi:hypothetical protein